MFLLALPLNALIADLTIYHRMFKISLKWFLANNVPATIFHLRRSLIAWYLNISYLSDVVPQTSSSTTAVVLGWLLNL